MPTATTRPTTTPRMPVRPIEVLHQLPDDGALVVAVTAYDASLHPAPVLCGFPGSEPTIGAWVSAIRLHRGRLLVSLRDLAPGFGAILAADEFKVYTAQFFSPDAPENPAPGSWYLRDVGCV